MNNNLRKTSYCGYIPPQSGNPTHDLEHIPEIQKMINTSIEELVPPMIERYCREIVNSMIYAIEYDVRTCVDIAFESANDIFHSEKVKRYVSDQVSKEILKNLEGLRYEIK